MKTWVPLLFFFLAGCASVRNYNPSKKFSPAEMQEDYHLFRKILEESHPGLYWYTPRDSMDYYFAEGESRLKDSLPEYKFRNVLSSVAARIRCGHTSIRPSKAAARYADRTRTVLFPLSVKAWDDTVVMTANYARKDSSLGRGTVITSIDGRPMEKILDTMFHFISSDGYNTTHKFQTVSNFNVFRTLYAQLYGVKRKTPVTFLDTTGEIRTTEIEIASLQPMPARGPSEKGPSARERKKLMLRLMRNLQIDTPERTAIMVVNTFSRNHLRRFFRTSFRELRKQDIRNLVIDIRGNGGGSVPLSNLLTKYIADKPFRIADSLYAIHNKSRYHHYIDEYLLNRLFFIFMTHKEADGHYHFRYFENREFRPRKKNHFRGTTYVVTGGNTFSAAALFTKALRDQEDVVVVGEETGGGAYGNNAWLIPDVTLPNTRVRFRLPLFRLVIDRNEVKGRGIIPEVEVKPTVEDIRKNADYKMNRVMELIRAKH